MFCRTMLPEDAVLKVVGGPGKEFWAAGKNWDIVPNGLNDENLALMGQWRVEVTPGRERQKDIFLHVIQVAGQDSGTGFQPVKTRPRWPCHLSMNEAELIEGVGRYGVRVKTGKQIWEIVFNSDGPLGGHIKRTGQDRRISRNLTTGVQKQVGIAARTYPAMTYEQAKARIPQRELPGFWVGGMEKLEKQLAEVSHGEVRIIANTPGGRLMHVVSFGERECVTQKATRQRRVLIGTQRCWATRLSEVKHSQHIWTRRRPANGGF